jgi:hypothetical protein
LKAEPFEVLLLLDLFEDVALLVFHRSEGYGPADLVGSGTHISCADRHHAADEPSPTFGLATHPGPAKRTTGSRRSFAVTAAFVAATGRGTRWLGSRRRSTCARPAGMCGHPGGDPLGNGALVRVLRDAHVHYDYVIQAVAGLAPRSPIRCCSG